MQFCTVSVVCDILCTCKRELLVTMVHVCTQNLRCVVLHYKCAQIETMRQKLAVLVQIIHINETLFGITLIKLLKNLHVLNMNFKFMKVYTTLAF